MLEQLTTSQLLDVAIRLAVKRLSPKIAALKEGGDLDSAETWQLVANFYELPELVDVLREHGLWTIHEQRELLNVIFALELTADRLLKPENKKGGD